ncbi:MAG: hypothetical protein OXC30_05745 [Alphaproteobacteria bacterium]|nr:hypothetical protein [Alphaproteobacteria bacterium]
MKWIALLYVLSLCGAAPDPACVSQSVGSAMVEVFKEGSPEKHIVPTALIDKEKKLFVAFLSLVHIAPVTKVRLCLHGGMLVNARVVFVHPIHGFMFLQAEEIPEESHAIPLDDHENLPTQVWSYHANESEVTETLLAYENNVYQRTNGYFWQRWNESSALPLLFSKDGLVGVAINASFVRAKFIKKSLKMLLSRHTEEMRYVPLESATFYASTLLTHKVVTEEMLNIFSQRYPGEPFLFSVMTENRNGLKVCDVLFAVNGLYPSHYNAVIESANIPFVEWEVWRDGGLQKVLLPTERFTQLQAGCIANADAVCFIQSPFTAEYFNWKASVGTAVCLPRGRKKAYQVFTSDGRKMTLEKLKIILEQKQIGLEQKLHSKILQDCIQPAILRGKL